MVFVYPVNLSILKILIQTITEEAKLQETS